MNHVLEIINTVIICLVVTPIALFTFYSLFVFIPPKKYKQAQKKHKFAAVIAARNEELVISNLIKSIQTTDYPKELLDIFVIAHNCTDKTAEVAKNLGVNVIEIKDDDPTHKVKGYALMEGFKEILKLDHEAYALFDADNLVHKDFFTKMNDAFDSGAKVCTGYRASKNANDNPVAGVNGLYFLRESIFNSHARTLIGSSCIVGGSGFIFSRELIEENGWDCLTLAEDAEFSFKYILKGVKAKYVSQAIYYDEQPTNFLVAMHRHARISKGTFKLFFQNAHKLLFKFFTTFKIMYLDMFINFLYGPICILSVLWFPFYYTYLPIQMIIASNTPELVSYLLMILKMVLLCIVLPLTIQNIVLYIASSKKEPKKNIFNCILTLIFFPFYNMAVCVANVFGIINPRQKWKQVKHDKVVSIEQISS